MGPGVWAASSVTSSANDGEGSAACEGSRWGGVGLSDQPPPNTAAHQSSRPVSGIASVTQAIHQGSLAATQTFSVHTAGAAPESHVTGGLQAAT